MREAFERAILDQPDDRAGYFAYADWLTEQGDPRGEFIAVQMALEDEGQRSLRADLTSREKWLLDRYERTWLGSLASHLMDAGTDDNFLPVVAYKWRWGFLTVLKVRCLTMSFAQAPAPLPAPGFLRDLHVEGEARYWSVEDPGVAPRVPTPEGVDRHWELLELIGSPALCILRRFQMGDTDGEPAEDHWGDCHTYAPGLEHVVACMPRIEELHLLCKEYRIDRLFALPNLANLRVLRLYHFGDATRRNCGTRYEYPLDVLAANPALNNLSHLLFHPHHAEEYDAGEYGAEHYDALIAQSFLPLEQVRALLRSPHLKRLTHLQLRLSNMGDAGVREIIDSGILSRLKVLDLRHGCVTDKGAEMLATHPESLRLELLDLSRNGVTTEGLRFLTQAGVAARANNPLTRRELDGHLFLFEGDTE